MAETKGRSVDFTSGSIGKKMIKFAMPLMFSSILQLLFNAADIIVVGRFAGDKCVAAVGSTTSLINLIVNLFIGLSVGANVMVANFFGARKVNDLSETVHTAITVSVISGCILSVIGFFFAPEILKLMNTPDDVIGLATIYMKTYFLGMPFMMLYNFSAAILRAVGDTKRPLYFLSAAGIINVALNLVFVIVFKWQVFGVAFATIISQTVSALLVLRCLVKEESEIRVNLKKLKVHKDKLIRMLQIGVPSGIQGMMFSISNVVIQSSINTFDTAVVAGSAASTSVEGFAFTSINAFHQSAVSFAGQNKGAGKYERINKILYTAWGYAFLTAVVFALAFVLLDNQLIGLYVQGEDVIKAGIERLNIIAWSYLICGFMDVTVGVIRGLGYSVMPTIVSLLGVCGIRILWIATVFGMERFHFVETIYYSYPISWTITFLAHLLCYIYIMHRIKVKNGVS
ncbi:MAG: MATE family efflux transporter [Clostridia bacterium]|nr:MATE family efflux transporter [Clostridia bacterium]